MLADAREQHIAAAFRAARPVPRGGWEERAMAAVADIRPRRHPNLLTYVMVAALILLLAAGVFAAVRHFLYVPGTLHFHDARYNQIGGWEERARFFAGELHWETAPDPTVFDGDISPDGNRVVFGTLEEYPPPGVNSHLVISDLDGANQTNLTEIAGIGGVNCEPKWSPDGTMIAFRHCDPVEGLLPCEAGFHAWVMNADGSGIHQVMPEGSLPTEAPAWSPDGSRLLFWLSGWDSWEGEQVGAVTTDMWGTDIQVLPNVGNHASWSPDGTMIASEVEVRGQLNGRSGGWNQLVLTDADGSNPRVLVENFVSEADELAHRALYADYPGYKELSDDLWLYNVHYWAGPCRPVWSPTSRQIAFLAALPFDPDGPFHRDQIEVWVYDLDTDELIQITDDDVGQTSIIWK